MADKWIDKDTKELSVLGAIESCNRDWLLVTNLGPKLCCVLCFTVQATEVSFSYYCHQDMPGSLWPYLCPLVLYNNGRNQPAPPEPCPVVIAHLVHRYHEEGPTTCTLCHHSNEVGVDSTEVVVVDAACDGHTVIALLLAGWLAVDVTELGTPVLRVP